MNSVVIVAADARRNLGKKLVWLLVMQLNKVASLVIKIYMSVYKFVNSVVFYLHLFIFILKVISCKSSKKKENNKALKKEKKEKDIDIYLQYIASILYSKSRFRK